LNEEILRLVAVGDFAHALKAIDEFKKFAITNISSVNREYAKFSSKIGNSLNKLEAAFERLATVTKRKDLISGLRGLGARISNIAREYAQDIGTLYEGLVSELDKTHNKIKVMAMGTPRFIGRGLPGAGATIRGSGEALVARYGTREINRLQAQINRLFTRMSEGLIPVEEFASKVQHIRDRMRGVVEDIERVKQLMTALSGIEENLTATMNTRVTLGDMLVKRYERMKAHHKEMISIAGILIDKNNEYYKMSSDIQLKVEELKQSESEIIQLYDREIRYAKEGLAILLRKGRPLSEIQAQTKTILNLEKQRNRELEKIRKQAISINKELQSDPYTKIVNQMLKKEAEINRLRKTREAMTSAQIAQEKHLIAVAGVTIDTRKSLYQVNEDIRTIVRSLAETERLINTYYDQEVAKKKKALNLLIQQKAPIEVVQEASREVIELEKLREKELARISQYMIRINRLLSSQAKGPELRKVINQLKLLAGEAMRTAKATSTLGLSNKELSSDIVRLGGATTGLFRVFSRWRNRLLVLSFAFAGLIRSMKQYMEMAAEAQKRSMALTTIATNFGISLSKVRDAMNKLTADGIIGFSDAAQALKNLLSIGADIDLVVENLEAMKDAALANGRAAFTAGENIVAYTQGIKEMRSQLTDSAGVLDNISTLLRNNKDLVQKVGQANALMILFTKKALQFEGMRAKMLQTLSGQLAILKTRTYELKVAIGEAIMPVMQQLTKFYMALVENLRDTFNKNKGLIRVYAREVGDSLVNVFKVVTTLGKALFELGQVYLAPTLYLFSKFAKVLVDVKVAGSSLSTWLFSFIIIMRTTMALTRAYTKSMEKGVLAAIAMEKATHKSATAFTILGRALTKVPFKAFGTISLIITLLTAVLYKVSDIIRKQKELAAIENKRLQLVKDLKNNYETINDVLGKIEELRKREKQPGMPSLAEYFETLRQLEVLQQRRKEIGKELLFVFKEWSIDREIARIKSSLKEMEDAYGETLKSLRASGVELTENGKILIRSAKTNEVIFRSSIDQLKAWDEVLKIVYEDTGAIPQMSDEVKKMVGDAREEIEKLKISIQTTNFIGLAKDMASAFQTFRQSMIETIRGLTELDIKSESAFKKATSYFKGLKEAVGSLMETMDKFDIVSAGLPEAWTRLVREKAGLPEATKWIDLLKEVSKMSLEAPKLPEKLQKLIQLTKEAGGQAEIINNWARALLRTVNLLKSMREAEEVLQELKQLQMQQMFQEWGQSLQKYTDDVTEFIDKSKQFRDSIRRETEERQRYIETLRNLRDISAYTEFSQKIAKERVEWTNKYNTQLDAISRKIKEISDEQKRIHRFYDMISKLADELGMKAELQAQYDKVIADLNSQIAELKAIQNSLDEEKNANLQQILNALREEYYLRIKIREEEERRKRIEQLFQRLEPYVMKYGGIRAYMRYQKALLDYRKSLWIDNIKDIISSEKLEYNDLFKYLVEQVGISGQEVEEKVKGIFELKNLFEGAPGFESVDFRGSIEFAVQELINNYVNELQKRQNKDILAQGFFNLLGGSLEMLGISGGKELFGQFFSVMKIERGLGEELAKLRSIDMSKMSQAEKDALLDRQKSITDALATAETIRWQIMAEIAKSGIAQYIEIMKGFHNLEIQYAAERVKLQEQLKYGLIDQETYQRKMQALRVKEEADRRVYWLRMRQQFAEHLAQFLAMQGVEMAFEAAKLALKGDFLGAAKYAALAILAGAGSSPFLQLARSYGLKAAKIEAAAEVRAQAIEQGYIGATTTQGNVAYNPMGSYVPGVNTTTNLPNYGVTLTNPTTAPTVNISLNLNADTMLMGSDIEEAGEMLGRKIVNVVNEAIETGEVQLSR